MLFTPPVTNCHTFSDPLPLERTLWTAPNSRPNCETDSLCEHNTTSKFNKKI